MTDDLNWKAIEHYCSFIPLGSYGVLWRVLVELELDLDRKNRFQKTGSKFLKKTDQTPLPPIRCAHPSVPYSAPSHQPTPPTLVVQEVGA